MLDIQRGLTFRGERIRPVFAEADIEVLRIFIARRVGLDVGCYWSRSAMNCSSRPAN